MECLQPREVHSCEVAKHGIYFASRTIRLYREADVSQEETGRSTEQSRRGVVYYIESRRFLIRDSPRPATTYEQKTGGADGVKGA